MGRKKPFSGKQKRQQLQAKKAQPLQNLYEDDDDGERKPHSSKAKNSRRKPGISYPGIPEGITFTSDSKFFDQKLAPTRMNAGRYALVFRTETNDEIHRLKQDARKVIHPVLDEYLECKTEDFYYPQLDFPVRPKWSYNESRGDIERIENQYFQEYLKKIDATFERSELSYFELNLETWRQLWRVLEMSDILLCIVDIRYPPLLFPPKLYEYVVKELGKKIIIVLNKIDLCPASLVLGWQEHFRERYPGVEVLCFTSFPSYNLHGNSASKSVTKSRKVRGRLRMAAEGALELYKVCEKIVEGQVDLTKWKQKILEEMSATEEEDEDDVKIESIDFSKQDTDYYEFKRFNGGILTIGCLGQPNVGKSSLINALMGKKVVSVSKTPGHTKHFQTIFLTSSVRLCDCPGLIFPSKVPKPLQVLCGSYPIAQLRDPFSTVKYLGERLDLPTILGISHPEGDIEWSAFDIADGWAKKRGYITAKTARLDSYRGANQILRMALDGKICLCLRPPGFTKNKDSWEKDSRVGEINRIQAKSIEAVPPIYVHNKVLEVQSDDEYDEELTESEEEMAEGRNENTKDDQDDEEASASEDEEEIPSGSDTKNNSNPKENKINYQNKFALLLEDDED